MQYYIIIFCLFFLSFQSYAATNLLDNPGFEEDASLWNDFYGGTNPVDVDILSGSERNDLLDWAITTVAPNPWCSNGFFSWPTSFTVPSDVFSTYNGSYAVSLFSDRSCSRISQSFPTVAGQQYVVGFQMRAFLINGFHNSARVTLRNTDENGTTLSANSFYAATSMVWQQETVTFTALSSTSYISFEPVTSTFDGNTNGIYQGTWIDDVGVFHKPVIDLNTNAVYAYDPMSENHKAIPGQVMVFDNGVRNSGGEADNDTIIMRFSINSNIAFEMGSHSFTDGHQAVNGALNNPDTNFTTINNSNLTCCIAANLDYSSVGINGPWGYVPSADFTIDGKNYDNDVRAIQINPSGSFADGSVSPTGFRIYYKGMVK